MPQAAVTTPLGRILVTVQAELEALVEGGIAVRRNFDMLQMRRGVWRPSA